VSRGFLLDTQAILDARRGAPLPPKVRKLFTEEGHDVWLSIASVWEIAIKSCRKEALELGVSLQEFVESTVGSGVSLLEIKPAHLYVLQTLPSHHRDPFDRLLVAQAMHEGLVIAGKDTQFDRYGVRRLW
jgi:PIN domain nuclease of toxin-antitoxin system